MSADGPTKEHNKIDAFILYAVYNSFRHHWLRFKVVPIIFRSAILALDRLV